MEKLTLFLQLLLTFDLLLCFPELVVSEIDILRSKKMHLISVSVGKKKLLVTAWENIQWV